MNFLLYALATAINAQSNSNPNFDPSKALAEFQKQLSALKVHQDPRSPILCQKYNQEDCRDFNLVEAPSDGIEKHMKIGNSETLPPELVDIFGGLWYMNGNPAGDEIMSFAGSKVLHKENNTYIIKVYDGSFSFNNGENGRKIYDQARTTGLHYSFYKKNATTWHSTPIWYLPWYMSGAVFSPDAFVANFDTFTTPDPNLLIRSADFFGQHKLSYRFVRIVYANGTRTEKYASEYLPNINKNATGITLTNSQLLPVETKK